MVNPLSIFRRDKEELLEANSEEIHTAINRLITLSTHDYGYYLFLVLSILITTTGLLLQSAPIIIGGMIIAPILLPLLSFGLAMILFEGKGIVRSLTIILISIIVALLLASATTLLAVFLGSAPASIDHVPGIISPELYFLVACCSGVAGTFAFVKKHLSSSILGVAVSASLLPPLCAVGIGVAMQDASLVERSLWIFVLNVIGIIVAAGIVFWILGFRKARKLEEKTVENVSNG